MYRLMMLAALAALFLIGSRGEAQTIATFGFEGAGDETNWATQALGYSFNNNVSVTNGINYSSGITLSSTYPYYGINYAGFNGDNNGRFIEFDITANAGNVINFDFFSISFWDQGPSGLSSLGASGQIFLRSSADNYANNYLADNPNSNYFEGDSLLGFDLSSVTALQNRAGTTNFRIFFSPYGDLIRLQNTTPLNPYLSVDTYPVNPSILMGGNVQAVPEPGTLILTGLALTGMSGAAWRRRRKLQEVNALAPPIV